MMPLVDILIPTYNRPAALAITLTSLAAQTFRDFRVIIADQTEEYAIADQAEVQAVLRVLQVHGQRVDILKNLPRKGMAHQRQFLLDQSSAAYVLFLDDDVILENFVINNMVQAIQAEKCGFVGSALAGLTFIDNIRPDQQQIKFWDTPVTPECVRPGTPAWERFQLHNAANIYHTAQRLGLSPQQPRRYKVAWIGGCVLYDAQKLRQVGGFSFWTALPEVHAGEDVLVQLRVMDVFGGCGLIPSGAYYLELPTTLLDRPVDAPKFFPIEMEEAAPAGLPNKGPADYR